MDAGKRAMLALMVAVAVFIPLVLLLSGSELFDNTPQLKPYKLALVLRSAENPNNIEMERAARRQEMLLGVNVIVRKVNQEINPQEQIDILHQLANENVDAIIIDPVDSMALLPVVKQYQAAGVPVINVGCRLDEASMVQFNMKPPPYVGIDNEKAGYDVGKYLADRVGRPTNVVLLTGINSSMTSDARKRGALRAFAENPYCVLKAARVTYWNSKQAAATAEQVLADYSTVGVWFCVDDVVATGAAGYISSDSDYSAMISGFGDLKSAETLIRKNKMTLTVAERSGKQIVTAIDYVMEQLAGRQVPPETYVEYALVDKKMLDGQ